MTENRAKIYVALIRIFLFLGVICLIVGFSLAASSPDSVFIGIAVMMVGVFSVLMAIIPTMKLIHLQNAQKESRINKSEE